MIYFIKSTNTTNKAAGTKLSTLSIVRNAKDEMTRMDDEKIADARTYQRLEQEQRGASDMDIFETNEKVIE